MADPEILSVRSAVTARESSQADIVTAGKILIVEDNSQLAESLAICLNEAGYETLWAQNSAQGINTALNERPDLILTDLNLPDMIAIDAMKILKNDPGTSGIPIVVLTAETGPEWKTKALKAGAADYLLKPISPHDLLDVVRRFCRTRSIFLNW
jgi:DNA-binding response OmpR family regulator